MIDDKPLKSRTCSTVSRYTGSQAQVRYGNQTARFTRNLAPFDLFRTEIPRSTDLSIVDISRR